RPLPRRRAGPGRAAADLRHPGRGGRAGARPGLRRRMTEPLPDLLIAPVVRAALAEDLGRAGDVTAQACIPGEARLRAVFASRQPGVVAGLACARLALAELDPQARFEPLLADGDRVEAGDRLARV